MRKDGGAADGIAAALDSPPAHQIDPAPKSFLQVFLERAHFKQPNAASGQKFNEQIHVASRSIGAACNGPKKVDSGHATRFTNCAYGGPDIF